MTATPSPTCRVGLVQMCSGRNVDKNVDNASDLIREATRSGAQYVLTPEVTTFMDLERDALLEACETENGNRALAAFQALAKELSTWLHIGSMPILLDGANLKNDTEPCFANRSYLISPNGEIAARYDKIHMFDVELANGETYAESRNYKPGENAVVTPTPWGTLGLTICYDLRFPYLHRALAHAGATMIAAPAAFTRPTGEAHWHVLLRARAIEAQCFVFAAAQTGRHEHGRATYGHSLIISPWGEILAEAGTEPCAITADIDTSSIDEVRSRVPSLTHDRPFTVTKCANAQASETAP